MKKSTIGVLATLAVAIAHAALVPKTLSENIAPHIETIPIQTLTISDEQFLKGDASGSPTTISGTLKVAQGSGRLPLVILLHGSRSSSGTQSNNYILNAPRLSLSPFSREIRPHFPAPHHRAGGHFRGELPYR